MKSFQTKQINIDKVFKRNYNVFKRNKESEVRIVKKKKNMTPEEQYKKNISDAERDSRLSLIFSTLAIAIVIMRIVAKVIQQFL